MIEVLGCWTINKLRRKNSIYIYIWDHSKAWPLTWSSICRYPPLNHERWSIYNVVFNCSAKDKIACWRKMKRRSSSFASLLTILIFKAENFRRRFRFGLFQILVALIIFHFTHPCKMLTVVSSSNKTWSYSLTAVMNIIDSTLSKQWIHFRRSERWPPTSNTLNNSILIFFLALNSSFSYLVKIKNLFYHIHIRGNHWLIYEQINS